MAKDLRVSAAEFGEILKHVRAGSGPALGRLLEIYRPALLAHARRDLPPELHCKCAVEDLVQQTFVNACEHFGQFLGQTQAAWFSWLGAIQVNKLRDLMREFHGSKKDVNREVRLDRAMELVDESKPLSGAEAQDGEQLLVRLRQVLTQEERELSQLRSHGLAWDDIARQRGGTAQARRMQLARAIDRVARDFHLDEDEGIPRHTPPRRLRRTDTRIPNTKRARLIRNERWFLRTCTDRRRTGAITPRRLRGG